MSFNLNLAVDNVDKKMQRKYGFNLLWLIYFLQLVKESYSNEILESIFRMISINLPNK